MKLSANASTPSLATPNSNAPKTETATASTQDTFKKSKSGPRHTLGRVVTYSAAAGVPGLGVFTNFLSASTGVSNVLKQQRGAEKQETLVSGLSIGAGVLAAVPNVLGIITHQAGWYAASVVLGGIAGAATAYQSKN